MVVNKEKGAPIPGKQYALTGGGNTPSIMRGDSWEDSAVDSPAMLAAKAATEMEACLGKYVNVVRQVLAKHYEQYSNLTPETVEVISGPKYWKVVLVRDGGGRSVHSFVGKASGNIYKPAGWSAPAKHHRGNILLPDHGREALSATGSVNYLR